MKSNAEAIMDNDLVQDWQSRLTQYNVRLMRSEAIMLCESHVALQAALSTAQSNLAKDVLAETEYLGAGTAKRLRNLFTRLGISVEGV